MKKINILWLISILMLLPISLVSCSDDDEEGVGSASELVGTWECTYDYYYEKMNGKILYEEENDDIGHRIKFNADGTCYSDGELANWSYKDGAIHIKSSEGVEYYPVKNLTSTELTIEAYEKFKEDGDTYEYYQKMIYKKNSD